MVLEETKMASIADVWRYFKDGYPSMASFKADWEKLSDTDKADLKKGVGDGTLTY